MDDPGRGCRVTMWVALGAAVAGPPVGLLVDAVASADAEDELGFLAVGAYMVLWVVLMLAIAVTAAVGGAVASRRSRPSRAPDRAALRAARDAAAARR